MISLRKAEGSFPSEDELFSMLPICFQRGAQQKLAVCTQGRGTSKVEANQVEPNLLGDVASCDSPTEGGEKREQRIVAQLAI